MTDNRIVARGQRNIVDLSPQRESFVAGFRVSSIRRMISMVGISFENDNPIHSWHSDLTDETCVFSPHDAGFLTDSFVIGTYHDHDDIVKAVDLMVFGSDSEWIDTDLDTKIVGLESLANFIGDCLGDNSGLLSPDESRKILDSLIQEGE